MNETTEYDRELLNSVLGSMTSFGDPLTILADTLARQNSSRISDISVTAHAFLYRWGTELNDPLLLGFSRYVQSLTGLAGDKKPLIELAKAISLYDFLKGVNITGTGSK